MTVKDLVQLYESSPPAARSVNSLSPHSPTEKKLAPSSNTRTAGLPPTPGARFIRRSSYRQELLDNLTDPLTGVPPALTPHPLLTTNITPIHDNSNDTSLDITDATDQWTQPFSSASTTSHVSRARTIESLISYGDHSSDHEEYRELLPSKTSSYPPHRSSTPLASTSTSLQLPLSSTLTLVQRRHFPSHTPVPATAVFARNAAPLYLPKLDSYLSSLPPPAFSVLKGKGTEPVMFPPMDQLAKSGTTIEDLEANAKRPPAWRDRNTILGSAANLILGLTGSSALATFYSLQGLTNTVQMFALILSTIVPVGGQNIGDKWKKLFLGTIPKILALNFASTLAQSLIFLLIFMTIAAGLLYHFYRSISLCDRYNVIEGLQQPELKGKQWGIVVVTFLLTVIYLPLSTMAVHVLVWSQDLWIIPNPYVNATSHPPVVPPLGPASEFKDPLDFCWTTTMKRNEVNYAPVVIIISSLVFLSLTVWFPITLHRVIRQSVPKVDRFTELGRPRSSIDMDREYQRLLTRDRNPFAFLYNGFRRDWGTYESTYLFAKLSTLVIVAIVDPDNCLFRSLSRSVVPIVRQVLLLISTVGFFLAQCFIAPFLDPVNNASEWTSRLNYVATAAVALGVALNIPRKEILNTYVLYVVYILTYGLGFYFTIINMGLMHRLVKRLTRRIDFSIDIFSPRLDISSFSPHTKRRIWQESISALLLTSSECKIPDNQCMAYAQARDSEFPPYLLDFSGSPGERHVENLKILREVGSVAYNKAVALVSGPDCAWFKHLEDEIQKHFIGPDCYWKNPNEPSIAGCTKFFGNAWWIPFPPTLVIRYDDGPFAVLREGSDLEAYIAQNTSVDIRRRREVRISLRALDGQIVRWPYDHSTPIGAHSLWCCGSKRYSAETSVPYQICVLRIKHRASLLWQGIHLGSGFDVELTYAKNVQVDGAIIGLNDDYDLTVPLARFLALNQDLIPERLEHIEDTLSSYRHHHRKECRWKAHVLTYQFLSYVYNRPRNPTDLAKSCIKFERDLRVRQLMIGGEAVFQAAYERLAVVSKTEAAVWWYIFWDDLWRRNHNTISKLELHAPDFNPHYPTSIAYMPLPRSALEIFLTQRGFLSKVPRWGDCFHSGFLNKLYLRMNETVFRGSSQAIMFHMGNGELELDMEDVDLEAPAQPSSLGTGGGTDHDDASIRPRPTYRWEGLLDDPLSKGKMRRRRLFAKLGAWFGITPLWRSGMPSEGVSLDVRLENGRYVLIEEEGGSSASLGGLGDSHGHGIGK